MPPKKRNFIKGLVQHWRDRAYIETVLSCCACSSCQYWQRRDHFLAHILMSKTRDEICISAQPQLIWVSQIKWKPFRIYRFLVWNSHFVLLSLHHSTARQHKEESLGDTRSIWLTMAVEASQQFQLSFRMHFYTERGLSLTLEPKVVVEWCQQRSRWHLNLIVNAGGCFAD